MIDGAIAFMEELVGEEYRIRKASLEVSETMEGQWQLAGEFCEQYVTLPLQLHFNNLNSQSTDESEEERQEYLEDNLRKRNLYYVEQYKNPVFGSVLTHQNASGDLFVFYVSDYDIWFANQIYRRFFVGKIKEEWKLLTIQGPVQPRKLEWDEFIPHDPDEPAIKDLGERVALKKLTAPEFPDHKKHYQQLKEQKS